MLEEVVLIIVAIAVPLFLVFLFFLIRFLNQSTKNRKNIDSEMNKTLHENVRFLRDEIMKMKENSGVAGRDLSHIKESITKVSVGQNTSRETINNLLQNVHSLQVELGKTTIENKTLNENVNAITQIFTSNYQRGDAGEQSLYFIIDNMFGQDNDIVHKQYQMKNGKCPDLFLKSSDLGIPIDSKFPYDNFLVLLNSKENDAEHIKNLKALKKNLAEHIKDVATKYISREDNTEQVFLYIPSQTLFDFINFNKKMEDVKKQAIRQKVILTAPNNFPAILRLVLLHIRNTKMQKHAVTIVDNIKKMDVDFKRFEVRWNKFENRINGLVNDTHDFGITTKKLKTHFEWAISAENKIKIEKNSSKDSESKLVSQDE